MSLTEEKKETNGTEEVITENQEQTVKELNDKYLRALADYQNLSRQVEKDKSDFYQFALADFLYDLLPIYEHLKLAIVNLNEAEAQSPWVEGVRHVLKQFKDLLTEKGVEEIITLGQKFDPECMEAVSGQGEIVTKEVKAGYRLRGKVIIPAKVIVQE